MHFVLKKKKKKDAWNHPARQPLKKTSHRFFLFANSHDRRHINRVRYPWAKPTWYHSLKKNQHIFENNYELCTSGPELRTFDFDNDVEIPKSCFEVQTTSVGAGMFFLDVMCANHPFSFNLLPVGMAERSPSFPPRNHGMRKSCRALYRTFEDQAPAPLSWDELEVWLCIWKISKLKWTFNSGSICKCSKSMFWFVCFFLVVRQRKIDEWLISHWPSSVWEIPRSRYTHVTGRRRMSAVVFACRFEELRLGHTFGSMRAWQPKCGCSETDLLLAETFI